MSAALRPLYIAMRAPALADRRGLRWMLNERLWPVPVVVLWHRGRRSGKLYATPVEAINEDRDAGEIVISPMRGTESDWYRNVLAGGLSRVRVRGRSYAVDWRELSQQENRAALARYRREHPLYGRMVLWMLMRMQGLSGEPIAAVAAALPMLSLRLR
ncbi:MAG: nitroreductase family deazaflavin-dependent oxidoreductase [Solirubrobacterales bacterium]